MHRLLKVSITFTLAPVLIAIIYQYFIMSSSIEHTHAQKNKEWFDSFAPHYDSEDWLKVLSEQYTVEFRSRLDWYGVEWAKEGENREVRMLDFACGPGMASNAFFNHVTQIRGVDISTGMVDEYNKRVLAKGISPDKMKAVEGDLLADDPTTQPQISGPEFNDFDFAVISLSLHHMENPAFAVKRLVERLKPGGVLVVLDWTDEPATKDGKPVEENWAHGGHHHGKGHGHGHGHDHGHAHGNEGTEDEKEVLKTVAHHGFNEDEMTRMFREAGCDDTGYIITEKPFKFSGTKFNGQERRSFLGRGRKAL